MLPRYSIKAVLCSCMFLAIAFLCMHAALREHGKGEGPWEVVFIPPLLAGFLGSLRNSPLQFVAITTIIEVVFLLFLFQQFM
jgi:hypothetical protein